MLVEARQQLDEGGHLQTVVMLGEQLSDSVNWETMLEQGDSITAEELEAQPSQVNVQDRMMLAYTSGTTANAK